MRPELVNYLRQLAGLLDEHAVSELTLRWGDSRVSLKRPLRPRPAALAPAGKAERSEEEPQPPALFGTSPGATPPSEILHAHLVGLFHLHAPDHDAPLVQVESQVQAGSVVGFIESMRVMNEVICPVDGQIMELYVEDGQPVEYGQELMRIAVASETEGLASV